MEQDQRLKRLYYQSGHRGTKELDIILGNFAEKFLHTLEPSEMNDYEALLEVEETDLYNWLTGIEPAPEAFNASVFKKIAMHRPL